MLQNKEQMLHRKAAWGWQGSCHLLILHGEMPTSGHSSRHRTAVMAMQTNNLTSMNKAGCPDDMGVNLYLFCCILNTKPCELGCAANYLISMPSSSVYTLRLYCGQLFSTRNNLVILTLMFQPHTETHSQSQGWHRTVIRCIMSDLSSR